MPEEIVPLLSCVLARRSILSIGGFSLAGGPDNQEIVRQHTESHLDPHTLQTPTTEPTQTPVGLGIREPQFHRLAPLAVDRLWPRASASSPGAPRSDPHVHSA